MQTKQEILQKVIEFEYSKIRIPSSPKNKDANPETQNNNRFATWNLEDKINKLGLNGKPFTIRWIGSGGESYLDAFVYCLLKGFSGEKNNKGTQYSFLKHALYQLSENSLTLQEQKELVEILCNANYTSNIPNFLNKSSLTAFVSKIIKATPEPKDYHHPIDKLKSFSKNFFFVNYEVLGDSSALMKSLEKEFYIIEERECIFVIEIGENKSFIEESKVIEPAGFSGIQKGAIEGTPSFITKNLSNRKGKTEGTYFSAEKQEQQKGEKEDYINENQSSQTNMIRSKTNTPISAVETLRNTIDIHINHLQSLTAKSKKEKNRSRPAHLQSKNKELNRGRTKSIVEVIESKSEEKNKKSLSPEKTPKIIPINSVSIFPRNKVLSKEVSPKNKFHPKKSNSNVQNDIKQQRVSFSYQVQ